MKVCNQRLSRRAILKGAAALGAAVPLGPWNGASAADGKDAAGTIRNEPETLVADPRVRLSFGEERMILPDGLQPSMLCTKAGTLVVQSQLSSKPHPQERIFYPYALATVVSRNGGNSWTEFPLTPGDNGVNIEGGIVQLRDGTILALETYVTPGERAGEGRGLVWTSKDDYRTLQGPRR